MAVVDSPDKVARKSPIIPQKVLMFCVSSILESVGMETIPEAIEPEIRRAIKELKGIKTEQAIFDETIEALDLPEGVSIQRISGEIGDFDIDKLLNKGRYIRNYSWNPDFMEFGTAESGGFSILSGRSKSSKYISFYIGEKLPNGDYSIKEEVVKPEIFFQVPTVLINCEDPHSPLFYTLLVKDALRKAFRGYHSAKRQKLIAEIELNKDKINKERELRELLEYIAIKGLLRIALEQTIDLDSLSKTYAVNKLKERGLLEENSAGLFEKERTVIDVKTKKVYTFTPLKDTDGLTSAFYEVSELYPERSEPFIARTPWGNNNLVVISDYEDIMTVRKQLVGLEKGYRNALTRGVIKELRKRIDELKESK